MDEKILTYIQKELLGAQPDLVIEKDENLLSTGLIDSLAMMRLVGYIEKEFNVKVPPQDMVIEHFMSVEAMVVYLNNRKS